MKCKETKRELDKWVMELAHYLEAEYELEWKVALQKAHLTKTILGLMGTSVVRFTYTKKDGTEGAAYRMKFKTRFPGQDDDGDGENHSTVDKSGGEQEEPDDIDEADIEDDTVTGDSELPF